jgi:hypothetical protein
LGWHYVVEWRTYGARVFLQYPSPSGLGSRLADGPLGLDELLSRTFHSSEDGVRIAQGAVLGILTIRHESSRLLPSSKGHSNLLGELKTWLLFVHAVGQRLH